jgi:hypothetical protein
MVIYSILWCHPHTGIVGSNSAYLRISVLGCKVTVSPHATTLPLPMWRGFMGPQCLKEGRKISNQVGLSSFVCFFFWFYEIYCHSVDLRMNCRPVQFYVRQIITWNRTCILVLHASSSIVYDKLAHKEDSWQSLKVDQQLLRRRHCLGFFLSCWLLAT